MNYNFKIGKGLGQITNLLGVPDKIIDDKEFISLQYNNLGLLIDYESENDQLIDLNIYTKTFLYENKNWFQFNKNDLLQTVRNIYNKMNLEYDLNYNKINSLNEEQYDFDDIGITLFFNENKLSNVCVSKPIY